MRFINVCFMGDDLNLIPADVYVIKQRALQYYNIKNTQSNHWFAQKSICE